MIRFFRVFDKGNFHSASAISFFLMCMNLFDVNDHPCPKCGAKHPGWRRHGKYVRNLIGFEEGKVVTHLIIVIRYRCLSCKGTHAILPASIIPYGSYSLLFIITVLKEHYDGSLTVAQLCRKYRISPSTLYEWKALYRKHKKVWLGLLKDAAIPPLQFLEGFFDGSRLRRLQEFFAIARVSFLQRHRRQTAQLAPESSG